MRDYLRYQATRRERRVENRARAIDYLGGVCSDCGATSKLEFDHVNRDRDKKWHTLAALSDNSWDRIKKELDICQLLCKSCHVKKSHSERGHSIIPKHGTTSMYSNYKCRCMECRSAWALYHKLYVAHKKVLAGE